MVFFLISGLVCFKEGLGSTGCVGRGLGGWLGEAVCGGGWLKLAACAGGWEGLAVGGAKVEDDAGTKLGAGSGGRDPGVGSGIGIPGGGPPAIPGGMGGKPGGSAPGGIPGGRFIPGGGMPIGKGNMPGGGNLCVEISIEKETESRKLTQEESLAFHASHPEGKAAGLEIHHAWGMAAFPSAYQGSVVLE